MEKVRIGIIGVGNQGSYYSKLIREGKISNGVLTAVCDIKENKLEVAKSLNQNIATFTNYKDMLDSGLIDMVIVTTPHYAHPEIVMASLGKGVHALTDKPAGVYTKQVREMNEFAKTQKALFGMMFNQRTNCVYRKMREMISGGEIGEIQRVNWIITDWYRTDAYYTSGGWRATWAGEGGGVLINQCPHQLDLVSWVVGMQPKYVNGFCQYGKWHDIEVEDDVTAYFEYENGATGMFITTTGEAPGTNRFEVSGTGGRLICDGKTLTLIKNKVDSLEWSRTATEGFKKPEKEVIEVETDGKNPQHAGIINNFTAALLGKEEFFVKGVEGINGVELMNAIELSGWKGGVRVELPVDEDEYLAELNKRRATSRLKVVDETKVSDTTGTF